MASYVILFKNEFWIGTTGNYCFPPSLSLFTAVVEQHHSLPVAQKSAPDHSRTVKCKGRHELSNAEQLSRVVCVLILLPDCTVSQLICQLTEFSVCFPHIM